MKKTVGSAMDLRDKEGTEFETRQLLFVNIVFLIVESKEKLIEFLG